MDISTGLGIEQWWGQVAYSAVMFMSGACFGHWLAIARDRRKEFNAVADPLSLLLDDQTILPSTQVEIDFRELRRHVPWWKLWLFDRAETQYWRSLSYENVERDGDFEHIQDNERVREAARALLLWTRRR